MTPLAVKNMSKAYEILKETLGDNIKTYVTDARCECGITSRVRGIQVKDNKIGKAFNVNFCNSCGDDDNFLNDLLY